ncbi:MAG: hypothetical protein IT204_02335 [Fimbriimonadaceae bacterium]|nr:hypothetical protein [Fimbriimonadaceae bacterium]
MNAALSCLLLLTLGAPAERLKLAVEAFRDPAGSGASAEATTHVFNRLVNVPTLTVFEVEEGVRPDYRYAIRGDIFRRDGGYQVTARCVEVQTAQVWPGSAVTKEGADLALLCRDIADGLAARLTGGLTAGAESEDQQARNDNSNVVLSAQLGGGETAGQAARLPIYLRDSLAKLTLTASEPGYYLVIGIGTNEVYQLYPPAPTALKLVSATRPLTIPNADYQAYGYSPEGFELVGDQPGVERVHIFFARRPIARHLPDPQVNPEATALLPRAYYDRWLPELRDYLKDLDPLWNGTTAAYYYAVTRDGIPNTPPAATAAPPPAAADRGAVVKVDEVVGVANIGDLARDKAHDLALLDARRNALEAALGVMLKSTTRVDKYELLEDKIDLESRSGFVRITRELGDPVVQDGALFVKIAAEVTVTPLLLTVRGDQELRDLYEDLERPRVLCLVSEEAAGQKLAAGGAAETQLVSHFRQAGFDVIDANQAQALNDREKAIQALSDNATAAQWLEANASLQAELVVVGSASGAVAARQNGVRVQTDLALNIVNAADGRVLWAETPTRTAKVGGGDDRLCCRDGLKQAVDALIQPAGGLGFLDKLAAEWVAQPAVFKLILSKVKKPQVDAFLKALAPAPLSAQKVAVDMKAQRGYKPALSPFNSARLDSFSAALTQITVRSPLRPARARVLLEELIAKQGWEITDLVGTRLNAAAKP